MHSKIGEKIMCRSIVMPVVYTNFKENIVMHVARQFHPHLRHATVPTYVAKSTRNSKGYAGRCLRTPAN